MPTCSVAKCNTYNRKTKGTNVSYHKFPKNEELRKTWINACKREDKFNVTNGKYYKNFIGIFVLIKKMLIIKLLITTVLARICSKHFNENSYKRNLRAELMGIPAKKVLKESAVPTENLPTSVEFTEAAKQRAVRVIKRSQKKVVEELLHQNEYVHTNFPNLVQCKK